MKKKTFVALMEQCGARGKVERSASERGATLTGKTHRNHQCRKKNWNLDWEEGGRQKIKQQHQRT